MYRGLRDEMIKVDSFLADFNGKLLVVSNVYNEVK